MGVDGVSDCYLVMVGRMDGNFEILHKDGSDWLQSIGGNAELGNSPLVGREIARFYRRQRNIVASLSGR